MKILKIAGFVVAGLLVLVIAALAIAAATFDPNDYRGRIADAVKKQTGRELALGDIQLKIFPWLNVSISDAKLSNAAGFGEQPFAQVGKLSVGVKLMPLLFDKQIQVSTVALEGLQINAAKNKDGVSNWDDLVKRKEAEAQAPQQAPEQKPEQSKAESQFSLDSLDIAGISISNAAVRYDDAQIGAHYELKNLKLKTSALSPDKPFDIDLAVSALSKAPEVKADIEFSGTITPDFKTQQFTTKDLKLSVNGLRATLTKDKNGRSNWEHLLKAGADTPEEAKDPNKAPFDLNRIGIAGIAINDAALVYSDAQSGAHYELSTLNFKTGAFTPGEPCDIDLKTAVLSKAPAANADLALSGTLKPDFKHNKLDTQDLKLTLKGKANELDVTATLRTRLLADFGAQLFNLQDLSVDSEIAGQQVPGGKQNLKLGGTIAYNGKDGAFRFQNGLLTAADLVLKTDISGTGLNTETPRIYGPLTMEKFSPRKLAGVFGIQPDTADPAALSSASLSTKINGSLSRAALQDLAITLDQTTIKGQASIDDFKTQAISFALKLDSIDADRYLPPKPVENPQAKKTEQKTDINAIQLPNELLAKLNANGTFDIGALKINNLKLKNIALKLSGTAGGAKQQDLSAQLYGGSVSLSNRFTPAAAPGYAAKVKLSSFEAAPFLLDLLGKDYVSGTANVDLDVGGRGQTVGDLRKTLSGNFAARAENGAVKGFNLGQIIRRGEAALAGNLNYQETSAPTTDFATITVSGKLNNGVLTTDDLNAASPLFRVGGAGTINLVNETIDYTAKPTIVETSKGQGGKELSQLNGVTIPIRLTGNLYQPKYKIDIKDAVKQKATEKVREELKGREDEVKQKINDKLGDLLFGKKKKQQQEQPQSAPEATPEEATPSPQ